MAYNQAAQDTISCANVAYRSQICNSSSTLYTGQDAPRLWRTITVLRPNILQKHLYKVQVTGIIDFWKNYAVDIRSGQLQMAQV